MKKLYITILLIILFINNGYALPHEPGIPQKCISTLAGVKYPKLVRSIPNDYSIKVFYETFGNARDLIRSEFKAGRKAVGVNGLWEDNHTFGDSHIPKIKAIGKELQAILNDFPDREIKFRPFTEHQIAKPGKYLDIAQTACPSCIIVNSNWRGGWTENPKYENEVHGDKSYPKELLAKGIKYNFDYDGTSTHDSDRKTVGEKHANSEEFCDWTFDLNLKMSEKDATKRPDRVHRPNQKLIRSLMFYTQGAKGTHNALPDGWIFKHCAERHTPYNPKNVKKEESDPRACTPVMISPANGKQIVCKMSNGRKLFSMTNKGLYTDKKRFVYRPISFQDWGYEYAKKALKDTNSPLCDIVLDGKSKGKVNPGWRDESYR